MKKNIFFAIIASLAIFYGCKDEETFLVPSLTAPADTYVAINDEVDIEFAFTTEAGYKSAEIVASKGTATIKTNSTAGAASGNIVVTFKAGTAAGAGSVVLTITDNENQIGSTTAIVEVKRGSQ